MISKKFYMIILLMLVLDYHHLNFLSLPLFTYKKIFLKGLVIMKNHFIIAL
jgi:hypothetical protein